MNPTVSFHSVLELTPVIAMRADIVIDATMPLKRMLDQRGSFDPKAVALLLESFDRVVDELGLQAPAEREKAAKLVIQVALGQPDLDAVKLRDDVLNLMLNETVTRRH